MALFSYKAMNAGGRLIRGELDAANPGDLEMRLKRMGLDLINGAERRPGGPSRGAGVPKRELINFCFHLEQLTHCGVPILEGLTDLREAIPNPRFRQVVASLIESIEGGRTLSQAMEAQPKVFNKVFCSLVRAGETSGNLPAVLKGLSESLKWQDELAAQTTRVLLYPAFVGTVLVGITVFLVSYLVPQLAALIRNIGQEVPTQTKFLLAAADVLRQYWYLIAGLPLLATTGARLLLAADPAARLRFDALKLRLPVVGPILQKIILSRFAGVFAMMYASGIVITEAIRATEQVVGNAAVEDGLKRAGRLIAEGQSVTAAFQGIGLFPPLVIRMLRVGENTGGLDTALANVAYFYNRDVKESIDKAQAMVEPTLTLVLGAMLGWVMLSVLGPIYDVIAGLRF